MSSKKVPLNRDDAEGLKSRLKEHASEIKALLREFPGMDRKTEDAIEHAWELLSDASKALKLPPKPPQKKPEPYRGGGTWHPAGMMPGGRYAPRPRSAEEW